MFHQPIGPEQYIGNFTIDCTLRGKTPNELRIKHTRQFQSAEALLSIVCDIFEHLFRVFNKALQCFTICRSQTAGVIVPPVCVDVNKDGMQDLLMLAFDGNCTLFDGHTLSAIWTINFSGSQSYR